MNSEKNSGIHKDLNPNATKEQVTEWEEMVKDLEERTKKEGGDADGSTDK